MLKAQVGGYLHPAVQNIRDVKWKDGTVGWCRNGQVQRIRALHL